MKATLAFSILAALSAQLGEAAVIPNLDARAVGPALIPTGTSYNGWTSLGCWQDTYNSGSQILNTWQYQPLMTFASCSNFCTSGGFKYMGMSNGQWCYCDNQINTYNGLGYATSADKCALPCAAEAGVNCGSFWTNSMFQLTTAYNADQAKSASASASAASYSANQYSASASRYSASVNAAAASVSAYSASVNAAAASVSAYSSSVSAAAAAASNAAYSAGVYSASVAAYSAQSAAAYSSNVAAAAASASAAASRASAYSASVAASNAAYSAGVYSASSAAAYSAQSAAAYSAGVAAAASAAAYSAGVYSASSAAAYSAQSAAAYSSGVAAAAAASAAAYSASVSASAAANSARVFSASVAAYSASVAASAAAYSAGVYSASSAAAYSAQVAASAAASAAAYSAGVYSASSNAAYSASSAAAYSASVAASAAAYSAGVFSASSNAAYSASSVAAYSASVSAAAAAATVIPTPWTAAAASCVAEGTTGRALTGASTSAPDMTYSKCLDFCASKGFPIAGLEYSNECYCGNALVNGASLSTTSPNCNMACGGSPSQTCGGPGALTVFVVPNKITGLGSDLTVKTAPLPSGWSTASTSCVAEGTTGRALTGASTASSDMTAAKCASYCAGQGFKYAGTEYGQECYCGNSLTNGASLDKPSSSCNMACGGDVNSICGGPGALSLYTNPSVTPPVTASTTPISGNLPSGWSVASAACIQEVNGRALTGASTAGNTMTTATCLSFCQSKGFQFAGLEFGQECYCGGSLVNGASLSQTSSQCNMPCAGDASATCGGPNGIQLYTNPSLAPAAPVAPVVNGFTSSGCIQEVAGRALTGLRVDFPDMTIDKCTSACANAGFTYAGVEYGQECYCGNSLVNGASTSLTSGQCVMDCPGNSSQKCGGPNAIQLYIAK